MTRDVYRYQKSIRYVSSIHCFDTRYVSSILICSKYQDKQVPVLMTGPPEPHFNMCKTTQDYGLVRNSAQESILEWNRWSVLVETIKFFSFLAEFRHAEGRFTGTIRYRYPCLNDFGYCIVEKYRYFRYIVYRYTSLFHSDMRHITVNTAWFIMFS